MRGGMEGVYADLNLPPVGFQGFAPSLPAHGGMFSARQRLRLAGETPARRARHELQEGTRSWKSNEHWHGATATTAMTHIAVQEALNGKTVDWMEKVSDEQYRA